MAKDIITIDNNEYQQWFQHLCEEIDRQRLKAVMQLNAATLQHYWWLGNDIIQKQKEQGWGAKVIEQLSVDLQKRYGSDFASAACKITGKAIFASTTCKFYRFSRWRVCASATCTNHLVSLIHFR